MTVITTRPLEVLEEHARLAEKLSKPDSHMADFLRFFMQSELNKRHGEDDAHALFFPVLPRGTTDATAGHGEELARVLGRGLRYAQTYEVTAEMTAAMRMVYDATEGGIEHIDEAELPCDQGFAWLDDGWPVTDLHGNVIMVRALSWDRTVAATSGTELDPMSPPRPWPCARLSLFTHAADDKAAGRDTWEHGDYVKHMLGTLTLLHTTLIPFGMRFAPPTAPDARSADSVVGLIHLLWMFLGMEITATERAQIKNHYAKRAMRRGSLRHGEVRVVVLRRVRHVTEAEPGHRAVDWRGRWVVQGHWRHRHEAEDRHRAIVTGGVCVHCGVECTYVAPFLKGPNGKPLIVSRTLHRLAR